MSRMLILKRPFIWLKRIRHRCGYGVHSPFAFDLITNVIYEKTHYYGYKSLAEEARKLYDKKKQSYPVTKKTNKLLFRMVNRYQPATIVHIGKARDTSLYLKSVCSSATFIHADTLAQLPSDLPAQIDFLHIDVSCPSTEVDRCCHTLFHRMSTDGLCVIGGIRYTAPMRRVWQKWMNDEQTGITFDLYDIGIVFFDKTKIKQHYTVNF